MPLESGSKPADDQFDKLSLDILKGIGKSVGQISLYNKPEHPSVKEMLSQTLQRVQSLLDEKTPSLVYSLMGDKVVVNGRIVGPMSQIPASIASFFTRHKLQSMTVKSGVNADDLKELCVLAAVRSGKDFQPAAEALAKKGIKSIVFNEAMIAVLMKGQLIVKGEGGQEEVLEQQPQEPPQAQAPQPAEEPERAGSRQEGEGGEGGGKRKQPRVDANFVRAQFGRYLSPELVEKLAVSHQEMRLGGETRQLTVMFTDIRGFTTLAEGMTPEAVTKFINSFLTPMSKVILDSGGFIDKYIGDCIMAFWNAPLEDPDHVLKAAMAAIAMRSALSELNQSRLAECIKNREEFKPVEIGIGINTGECCVGNIGSEQRFEYSALGDAVNLASRLEGQSKTYGVDIVIGPETNEGLSGFAALELDLIRVKGKKKPGKIFGLLGDPELASGEPFVRLLRLHAGMLEAYRDCRWDEAERFAGACRSAGFPLNPLYDLYQNRIQAFRSRPPAPDWDGVFSATQK